MEQRTQKSGLWPVIISVGIIVGVFSYVIQSFKIGCGDWKDPKSCSVTTIK